MALNPSAAMVSRFLCGVLSLSKATVRRLFREGGVEKKFAGRIYIFESKEKASQPQARFTFIFFTSATGTDQT